MAGTTTLPAVGDDVSRRAPTDKRSLSIAMIGLRGIPATYGGVERAVEELSAALVDRGHDVTVFARRAYSDPELETHRGVKIRHLPQWNTKHLEAISHTSVAVAAAIAARRFDIVHFHATGPGLLSFVPRLVGIPTVVTVQGLDWRREKWGPIASSVLRVAARAAVVCPTRTIVVSRGLQQHYQTRHGAQPVYIPNGVDPHEFDEVEPVEGLTADRFVLFLGRLVPEKHVHTLIEAYRGVDTDVPLVVAGPSSHSSEYVAQLEALAARDARVRLVGPQYGPRKAWLLRNATAFVQPSSIEGLPIALLEALACGRFPIVSEIPENLEPVTVGGRTHGIVVPVGDVRALTSALSEALLPPRDRAEIGSLLKRHVSRTYDWAGIAARTEELYRAVLT